MDLYIIAIIIIALLIANIRFIQLAVIEDRKLKSKIIEYTKTHGFGLSREDFDFLIELQHEMLTQDHVSQAAPRFWVVAGTQKVYVGEEYAEGEELVCDDGPLADGIEEAIKYFQEEYLEELKDDEKFEYILEKEAYNSFDSWHFAKIEKDCNADTVEGYVEGEEIIYEKNCISSIGELIEALEEAEVISHGRYDTACYRKEHYRYPDTMFLTNRSCKEHIRLNHYHYSGDAHSYAMTAWRSPEVERLWNILDVIDWKSMKEEAYGTSSSTERASGKTDDSESSGSCEQG